MLNAVYTPIPRRYIDIGHRIRFFRLNQEEHQRLCASFRQSPLRTSSPGQARNDRAVSQQSLDSRRIRALMSRMSFVMNTSSDSSHDIFGIFEPVPSTVTLGIRLQHRSLGCSSVHRRRLFYRSGILRAGSWGARGDLTDWGSSGRAAGVPGET